MNEPSWTLEGELKELAGQDDLDSWLHSIRLLERGDTLSTLATVRDWYPSGAETYSLRFAVLTSRGQRHECFMKACVPFPSGIPLKDVFAQWLSRRAVVEELGIDTPRLYAAGTALLVEEYIPHTLSEALARAADRTRLLRSVGWTAACLVKAGFAPISAHDWRSRGEDVVLVDFGQDLGPAGLALGSESGLLSEVLDNLANAGLELSAVDLQIVGSVYERVLCD